MFPFYSHSSGCNHKFDVILFDDANEIDEALSTMLFLFAPSSFILFGGPYRNVNDQLGINQKYPQWNLNQSMFERLRNATRCVLHLDSQHRFGEKLSQFVSKCLYGGKTIGYRKTGKPLDAVKIYHRKTDGFCQKFIKKIVNEFQPRLYSYGVVHPPNIVREYLQFG